MGSHSVNSKIGRFQRKMNNCRDEFCRLKLKFSLTILVRSVEIAREFKFSILFISVLVTSGALLHIQESKLECRKLPDHLAAWSQYVKFIYERIWMRNVNARSHKLYGIKLSKIHYHLNFVDCFLELLGRVSKKPFIGCKPIWERDIATLEWFANELSYSIISMIPFNDFKYARIDGR